jgi:hypothetical protein
MRVGGVEMIIRRVGAARGAKATAIFFRHARGNRGMILDDVAVAVNDLMFGFRHGLLL